MATVDTVYWLPIYAGLRLKPVGLVQRLAATWWFPYSLCEPSELS